MVANEFVSDTERRPAHGDFLPPLDGYSRPGGYWSQTSALLDPLIAVFSAPWVSPAFQDAPFPPHPRPDRAGPRVVKRREGVWSWILGVGISFLPISWGGVPQGRMGRRSRKYGADAPPLRPDAAHRPTSPSNGEEKHSFSPGRRSFIAFGFHPRRPFFRIRTNSGSPNGPLADRFRVKPKTAGRGEQYERAETG